MKTVDKNMELEILNAAEKLFLEQGFEKTTTEQIAKLAGCNQALIHYYYRTKNNLFEKVFKEKIQLMGTNMLALANTSGVTLEEKITKMLEFHFDFLKQQNLKFISFMLNEILTNQERMQLFAESLKKYLNSILVQLDNDLKKRIQEGTIYPTSATDLMMTMISLNFSAFVMTSMFQKVLNSSNININGILENRKKQNVHIILSYLKK